MYLQTLVILFSIRTTFCNFLLVHDGCKYWDYLKVYGKVEGKIIHCILDQDFQSGLVYTEWIRISKGICPIYNRFARQIDTIPCNGNIGMCPNESFPSYSGVTFSGCYDAIRKQTNVIRPTTNVNVSPAVSDQCNRPEQSMLIASVSLCINCILIICLFVSVWHFIFRSRIKQCRAADKHKWVEIRDGERVVYRGSKPDDAEVQKAPCSERTSETYSKGPSADSKASED